MKQEERWANLLAPIKTDEALRRWLAHALWALLDYEGSSSAPDKDAIRKAEIVQSILESK